MRPRLRADVRYVPTEDGVHVFSAAGSFGLTGGAVYPLLDQLAGYLDGSRTVGSIVAGLPERHRRVVTKLLDTLVARRVVYDAEAVRAHQLQDWELQRYEQEVAFVDLATGSGAYWFERFRLAEVLLVGGGTAFDALVRTMLRLGARRCGVLVTADVAASRSRHRSYLQACRQADPRLGLTEVSAPAAWDSATAVQASLAGYDAVLHCEDQPRPERTAVLGRAAEAAGIASLHAAVLGNSAWVGPSTAGPDLGCWECAMRYLAGARPTSQDPGGDPVGADDPHSHPAGPQQDSPWASEPIRAMVGAMLAMAYFRRRTEAGIDGTGTNRLVRIDLETANAREHRFVRHPSCQVCPAPDRWDRRAATDRIAVLQWQPARTDEDLSQTAAALHDPQVGVMLSLDESDQVQLPLVITVAAVNDLTGSGQGPRWLAVAAPDHARARRRAAVYALETAAALAAAAPGRPQLEWAWSLTTDAVVPAPITSRTVERVVAAGYDWAEAVGRGLLRHSVRLAGWGPKVDGGSSRLADRELTDGLPKDVRDLLDATDLVGRRLRLQSVPGLLGLPAVEVLGAGGSPVRAAALDLPQAVTTAVETAVGRVQQALTAGDPDQHGDRDDASGAVVAGGVSGAVVAGDVPADLGDGRWSTHLSALAGSLRNRGWRAYARPIELPTGAGGRPPVIVEVTLVPEAREAGR